MTATIDFTQTTATTAVRDAMSVPAARTAAPGADLLELLYAKLTVIAFDDPDGFPSWRETGRELLELAGTARRATAYLGGDPGTAITTDVPGVVVVRELAAATRALAAAVALTSRP